MKIESKKNKFWNRYLIFGFIGMLLIFFIPLFPVELKDIKGTSTSIWWNNGLMNLHSYSMGSFLGIELIGFSLGVFIFMTYYSVFNLRRDK